MVPGVTNTSIMDYIYRFLKIKCSTREDIRPSGPFSIAFFTTGWILTIIWQSNRKITHAYMYTRYKLNLYQLPNLMQHKLWLAEGGHCSFTRVTQRRVSVSVCCEILSRLISGNFNICWKHLNFATHEAIESERDEKGTEGFGSNLVFNWLWYDVLEAWTFSVIKINETLMDDW